MARSATPAKRAPAEEPPSLDRTQPYGEIVEVSAGVKGYRQGDNLFDADGKYIGPA